MSSKRSNYKMVVTLDKNQYVLTVEDDSSYIDGFLLHIPSKCLKDSIQMFLALVTQDDDAQTGSFYHVNKNGDFSLSEWERPDGMKFCEAIFNNIGCYWFNYEYRSQVDASAAMKIDIHELETIYKKVRSKYCT